MEKYEEFKIENLNNLKKNTIYFYLKTRGFSENYIKNLRNCEDGILLNNTPATVREKIGLGDVLDIKKNPNRATQINLCEGSLDILFEDEDYLIVNKPHNLACTPTRSHFSNNLGGQICRYMNDKDENFVLRILNRLDKETAGIVVVAKNVIAYKNADIDKEYHALCHGNLSDETTICHPIKTIEKDGINQMKRVISENGKHATTHVFPLKNWENFFLAKFKLETGRTHQIRVHMSHIQRPLLGDTIYGKPDDFSHTMLLLKKIQFTHFRTKKKIEIEVAYPEEWKIYV
ncbi:MAG: RluA family pseudouridine synthase [Clostridia bacterium]|nr:RluA family pseudouridine synthase [Clostridia bacterium]